MRSGINSRQNKSLCYCKIILYVGKTLTVNTIIINSKNFMVLGQPTAKIKFNFNFYNIKPVAIK